MNNLKLSRMQTCYSHRRICLRTKRSQQRADFHRAADSLLMRATARGVAFVNSLEYNRSRWQLQRSMRSVQCFG